MTVGAMSSMRLTRVSAERAADHLILYSYIRYFAVDLTKASTPH